MFGSYSSYSSMSTVQMTTPIDIGASTAGSSTVCAFPSWPRRSYLDDHNSSASSFLSDEDLFLDDFDTCSFSSSSSSRSSSNASSISPPADWCQAAEPFVAQVQAEPQQPTEEEYLEIQRQRQAYQRELVRSVLKEKETRKQARRQRRAATGPSTTSSKKSNKLTAISEDA
ncbi:hypothetical protein F503_02397 [Ophiostoma piceae UAMH 11346]|uniref:Uncharacterized protein n=1 Tax=Ophiostoma piceae (strain UAMH 11346) TaxID=1262450 RepID=S3BYG3_OPHP1|nr:hypothetical protein F503_02397 [Ophiostoma piceae UAMH 11346]